MYENGNELKSGKTSEVLRNQLRRITKKVQTSKVQTYFSLR